MVPSGMDRAERDPVSEAKYQAFRHTVLAGVDPNQVLAERPAWVQRLPGPLADPEFPGDHETVLKYWSQAPS
jgi:hypothetical protein